MNIDLTTIVCTPFDHKMQKISTSLLLCLCFASLGAALQAARHADVVESATDFLLDAKMQVKQMDALKQDVEALAQDVQAGGNTARWASNEYASARCRQPKCSQAIFQESTCPTFRISQPVRIVDSSAFVQPCAQKLQMLCSQAQCEMGAVTRCVHMMSCMAPALHQRR